MQNDACIIQISTKDIGGGAESCALYLHQEYIKRGYKAYMAVGRKYSSDKNIIQIDTNKVKIKKRIIWKINKYIDQYSNLRILRYLLSGHEDFDYPESRVFLNKIPYSPSIIHCHNLHGYYFDLRSLILLSKKAPTIINMHDSWLLTGHCSCQMDCVRWKTGCGKCPDISRYPSINRDETKYNWQIKKNIYDKSRLYITTPSKWLMDCTTQSILKGAKYKIVPNGIDLNIFQIGDMESARHELGIPKNITVMLFIAHNPFKDRSSMEEAIKKVFVTYKKPCIAICIGTEVKSSLYNDHQIVYVGKVLDPIKMSQYYQASNVYLHMSHAETFGKTIAEAMASALPVVASNTDGIPELITNGRTGYLIPHGDIDAAATMLIEVLNNPENAIQIGHNASSYARNIFSLEKQVITFLEWYQEITEDWNNWKNNNYE